MIWLQALLLAACAAAVSSRSLRISDVESISPLRALQQATFCPDGCMEGQCTQDGSTGALRCSRCMGSLVVSKITGECVCPVGRYSVEGSSDCRDCPKGSFCAGSVYRPSAQPPVIPAAVTCPPNMTTLGMRSISDRACVNLPGFYYTLDSNNQPGAVQCPVDTYGPGLKKQRACVPCPTGFTTDGKVQQTRPAACVVPAGYYLKAPGQVAPCPQGEWKAGIGPSANCTKCEFGVTTPHEASTSESECKLLRPGHYALEISPEGTITKTQICPQKYFCPGGPVTSVFDPQHPEAWPPNEGSIKPCPSGMWTVGVGSAVVQQCLTPPGFYTNGNGTQPCPAGTFRADWKPYATTCESCGEGVMAERNTPLFIYSIIDNSVSYEFVTASSDACYIQPGQGLYFSTATQSWRARNCDSNNYGLANRTYGLTPRPCRDCPTGQVASTDAATYPTSASYFTRNADGSGGFTSERACVNQPGYGYNGRGSQRCDKGTYNAGDNYGTCMACPDGYTTADVGAGITQADCGIRAGFGNVNGTIKPCPLGTYNAVPWTAGNTSVCTKCPGHTTTTEEGADAVDLCNLCKPGYGGVNCTTQCGGLGPEATFGPVGREAGSPCKPCSNSSTGFSFDWQMQNELFQAYPISKPGADRPCDCLSEFQQIVDGAWYIPVAGVQNPLGPTNLANSFAECVAQCTGPNCAWATYDYRSKQCYTRTCPLPMTASAPILALKSWPSGDVLTSAWHKGNKSRCIAKSVTSGHYSFYRDDRVDDILGTEPAAGREAFTSAQECLNACDDHSVCAGVILDTRNPVDLPKTCRLLKGDGTLGTFIRTVTRTDVTRLGAQGLF